jgi:hypothetical protein
MVGKLAALLEKCRKSGDGNLASLHLAEEIGGAGVMA